MRLCDDNPSDMLGMQDALDSLTAVLAFMNAALCGSRELPWQDDEELWGAQLVFDALIQDLRELRADMTRQEACGEARRESP